MRTPQRVAKAASCHGEHKLHRLGAVVAKGNSVISIGWNRNKTHPKSTHAWKYIHAEMSALMKAGEKASGADLYVARVGRDGVLRNSMPCPACMALIASYGIKRVFFTNENEWLSIKVGY